jgi:hypothetical protein
MLDNVNFDQIRTDKKYNFLEQYIDYTDEYDNPLQLMGENSLSECNYYNPEELLGLVQSKDYQHNALSTFHINCQSINAHWDKLQTLLNEVTCPKFTFDIIGLTEIFQIHEFTNYNIEGYHPILYKTRPSNQGNRGGVG